MNHAIDLTGFASPSEPNGADPVRGTFAEFVELLRHPAEYEPSTLTLEDGSVTKYQKPADLGGFAPGRFRGNYRKRENVIDMSAVPIEFDGTATVDELRQVFGRFAGAYYSTFNHQHDGRDRVRVVVLTSRPITADEYDVAWRYLQGLSGNRGDESAKDASRFWYLPGHVAGRPYVLGILEGEPLDVDALPAPSTRPESVPASVTWEELPETLRPAALRLAAGLREECPTPGKRHRVAGDLAGALVSGAPGGPTRAQIPAFVEAACGAAGFGSLDAKRAYAEATASKGQGVTGWPTLEREHPKVYAAVRAAFPVPDLTKTRTPAPSRFRSPAERALALGGTTTRLATGMRSLDTATRGGLPIGKFAVFGGAPGAGKTTTAINLAHKWASEGVHVAVVAADEDADGLLVRFGQLAGLSRDELENGEPAARETLANHLRRVPLMLVDLDEDGATLEDISQELAARANGARSVLIVDSLQTVRVEGAERLQSIRERIDRAVVSCKRAAKVDRHLVIATSELSRGAYRSQDAAERVSPLAAFKESGGIEYGVSLALVLYSRAGAHNLIDVAVPKNRLGPGRPEFVLGMDFARAAVAEVEGATGPHAAVDDLERRVLLEFLATNTPLTRNQLVERVGGRKANVLKAIGKLLDQKKLVETSRGIQEPDAVLREHWAQSA